MFIRSETRKVSFEPEYLRSDDLFCIENKLSNIEVVSESVNSIFNEYVEYYVTYKARTNADVWQIVDKMNESVDIVCAEPNYIFEIDEDDFEYKKGVPVLNNINLEIKKSQTLRR